MTGTSGTFDYLEHWGLERTPFSLAPDPQRLFLSRQHGECLLRLKYAVMARQGGALLVSQNAVTARRPSCAGCATTSGQT